MEAEMMELKNTVLGIELGSTRIKAVLIDDKHRSEERRVGKEC